MTVGELKKAIAGIPDDTKVIVIERDHSQGDYAPFVEAKCVDRAITKGQKRALRNDHLLSVSVTEPSVLIC